MNLKKRKAKRRWSHAPRNDRWRKAHGIPANTAPALLSNRREQYAAVMQAKQKREPRIVQRSKRLAARSAAKQQRDERKRQIEETLRPKVEVQAA